MVSGAKAVPTQSKGAKTIALTAKATDPTSPGGPSRIAAAEWFMGTDPGPGHGVAMAAVDGVFNSTVESIRGSVPTAHVAYGEHLVGIRARDAAGNWGSPVILAISVTPADVLFADGFESGTLGRWTRAAGGGRLRVLASVATGGRWGLEAALSGAGAAYVADGSPAAATRYRARFTMTTGSTTTGGAGVVVFSGIDGRGAAIFRLQLRRSTGGRPQVRLLVARLGGTSATTWLTVSDAATSLQVSWSAAAGARPSLLVNGVTLRSVAAVDTSRYRLEEVRLGPSGGLKPGLAGTLAFDRFVSDRVTSLGL